MAKKLKTPKQFAAVIKKLKKEVSKLEKLKKAAGKKKVKKKVSKKKVKKRAKKKKKR